MKWDDVKKQLYNKIYELLKIEFIFGDEDDDAAIKKLDCEIAELVKPYVDCQMIYSFKTDFKLVDSELQTGIKMIFSYKETADSNLKDVEFFIVAQNTLEDA